MAEGSFAEAQAVFLNPDPASVTELDTLLRKKNVGVVAHFYMDAELQGTLLALTWPHVSISDSLVMADRAVEMAKAGVAHIVVLGVDFMSENVQAVLASQGFGHIPVYRADEREIGCSLAEAAEKDAYWAYLKEASHTPHALHVVYINTSLKTKALATQMLPTITCTSSNVLKTILQASLQEPNTQIYFGPDTYMGANLHSMLGTLATMTDAQISRLHPGHSQASVARIHTQFHWFKQGNCVVHHMFGASVVKQIEREESGSFLTAHLEVPGEMFALALEAGKIGRGVVGSTSDILRFIADKAKSLAPEENIRVVLGTETGMVSSIVKQIRTELKEGASVTLVFPIASDAVSANDDAELSVLPGTWQAEGCSLEGGCATCPYMKMNSLNALMDVLSSIGRKSLTGHLPKAQSIPGMDVAQLGTASILAMRTYQRTGKIPQDMLHHMAQYTL